MNVSIDYEELWAYVKSALAVYDQHGGMALTGIKFSRFEHTERVYRWMMILAEEFADKIDMEALQIATILHDIGYSLNKEDMRSHAQDGAVLSREYLERIGYPAEKTEFICSLIARHSDKNALHAEDSPLELVLLMEADLLDDTGAHGIIMDTWIRSTRENVSFESILAHIKKFSWRQIQKNPMRTEKARRIWEEKRELTNRFVESLSMDLYGKSEDLFKNKLAKEPLDIKDGIYYFAAHDHGDFFDEEDVAEWDNGRLESNWKKHDLRDNPTTKKMIETIVANGKEVIDLACGPGMGLIPSVKQLDSAFHCTATDANAMVLEHWKKYLDWNFFTHGVGFAQFSVLDMPFKDNSVPSFSSYIGLSSTRNGEAGYDVAVKEVYRCLMPGGYLYAVESEWMDVPAILQVFEKWGQEPWTCFTEERLNWHDRFVAAGFEIVSEEEVQHRIFTAEDNELGEASVKFGIPVGTKETAFILRKKK